MPTGGGRGRLTVDLVALHRHPVALDYLRAVGGARARAGRGGRAVAPGRGVVATGVLRGEVACTDHTMTHVEYYLLL